MTGNGTLREALEDMVEEFKAYDLPYGSKAYNKAASALLHVKSEESVQDVGMNHTLIEVPQSNMIERITRAALKVFKGDDSLWEEHTEIGKAVLDVLRKSIEGPDFWPVDEQATRMQLIRQINVMNFHMICLSKNAKRLAKPQKKRVQEIDLGEGAAAVRETLNGSKVWSYKRNGRHVRYLDTVEQQLVEAAISANT